MLLFGLELLAATYIGTRILEKCQDKRKSLKIDPDPRQSDREAKKTKNDIIVYNNEKNTTNQKNLKISTASVGLSGLRLIYPPLTLLSVGMLCYATLPILKEAEHSVFKKKRITNDLLNATVNVICLGMGQYFITALLTFYYHFAEKMVVETQDKTRKNLTDIFVQQPSTAWLLVDVNEIEVPVEQLKIGDIIVLNTGGAVPIDGIITEGSAIIDQHALTGESIPADKQAGDQVFASTLLVSGRILVKIEKTGEDTTVSKLQNILSHTADFKTKVQSKGEKWADKAALPLLGAAALTFPFIGILPVATLLDSSPGNSIKILTSLQLMSHLSLASKKGILVKDGRALEELLRVDTVLFDKTGTLTTGEPEVGEIIAFSEMNEVEILTCAAVAEHKLTHPIALAVLKKAAEHDINLPDIEHSQYDIGYGITVQLEEKTIQIGSSRFMEKEGVILSQEITARIKQHQNKGCSLIMVAINHIIKGAIEIKPQVRPEAKEVISALLRHGVQHISIVSGDHKEPTQQLAEELGLTDCFYDVLPQSKAHIVEKLQKEGKTVCFIGDGINDALAMKKANVALSLSGAYSIATDMAQVVFMDGTLSNMPYLFNMSKEMDKNLKASLALCIGSGTAVFGGAVLLGLGPLYSMILWTMQFGVGATHAKRQSL